MSEIEDLRNDLKKITVERPDRLGKDIPFPPTEPTHPLKDEPRAKTTPIIEYAASNRVWRNTHSPIPDGVDYQALCWAVKGMAYQEPRLTFRINWISDK